MLARSDDERQHRLRWGEREHIKIHVWNIMQHVMHRDNLINLVTTTFMLSSGLVHLKKNLVVVLLSDEDWFD